MKRESGERTSLREAAMRALDNAYAAESRTRDGYEAWLKRWVLDVPDRQTYMTMVDVDSIRITGNRPSEPVNFADE